ncbi:hypothetical protein SPFL3102_01462 [Sporomusaceae bacterium FL31]|nr:hypothetical protein SPFL3101_03095 [Sporomusaceae bacterium FL31]GCE33654.1 hypothetical protein SPFL3102_01462 [Sporomusaceae bacterium]
MIFKPINLFVCMLICTILWPASLLFAMPTKNTAYATEAFIKNKLTNPNGTPATYLLASEKESNDLSTVAGRDSLSESLGLWMQYALVKNDAVLFQQCYQILIKYYLLPNNLIAWQVSANGEQRVSTNALIDDLRILDALLLANERWPQPEWQYTAKILSLALDHYLVQQGQLVDFYDEQAQTSPHTLTLLYLNPIPIQKAAHLDYLSPIAARRSLELLRTLPDDGIFYPKTYDVNTKAFYFADKVNLLDQMLIALNRQAIAVDSAALISFIKTEFYSHGKVMTDYNRASRAVESPYESPALYAVLILYALQEGDDCFARDIYQRMICFRMTEGENRGGYMNGNNTHIFDNLLPLIAETVLIQQNGLTDE